jgi:V/A-type H+-transporting ATPase subunit I
MTRVRIAGPMPLLDRTLSILQNLEVFHVVHGAVDGTAPPAPREAGPLRRVATEADAALSLLGATDAEPPPRATAPLDVPRALLYTRRVHRRAERLARADVELDDERALLLRFQAFFAAFEPLDTEGLAWKEGQSFFVVLRAGAEGTVGKLRASLEAAVDGAVELLARPLDTGETAVLVVAPGGAAPRVAELLAASNVHELPAPEGIGGDVRRAATTLHARLAALAERASRLEQERRALRDSTAKELARLRAAARDRLLVLDARAQAHAGRHLFILEGFVPAPGVVDVAARVRDEVGLDVLVEAVGTEPWTRTDAPVALSNPPLFRPFEVITRTMPLPRYGTIDPTPFVAVFFPMFFGLILGDAGYGALLVIAALVLRARSKPGTTLRSVSAVAGACAAFSVVFGLIFGEVFGDLGKRALGMRAHGFDRESAILPFLAAAVALGVVHVTLGLVLAVVSAWRLGKRREALGRGVAALMVALTVAALLTAFEVLPAALFTPIVVAILVAFPVLVLLEGVVAVVELVSSFGQILSYARIMALGTASLMLAVVANRMVGAMGSVAVGIVFALLFHLVNFAIGLFSPTIHALRLHYVEFFGRFFSPGGTAYRPLSHWHPAGEQKGNP